MTPAESFPRTYVAEVSAQGDVVPAVETGATAFVGVAPTGPQDTPVRVGDFDAFERSFGALTDDHELGWAVLQFFRNGGADAWVVRAAAATPSALAGADRSARQGLFALDGVPGLDLLCLPGISDAGVLRQAIAYCAERSAFALIDAPASAATAAALRAWLDHDGGVAASANAALHHPWVCVADPRAANASRAAPPSGTLAGLYARTDRGHGVWRAPAGADATLAGVRALVHEPDEAEVADLAARGVNCLRSLRDGTQRAWSAHTLRPGAPELASIPVRRLTLSLQRSLQQGLAWVVFEANDSRLWARIGAAARALLDVYRRNGALQGPTAAQAYFVHCSAQTMTQDDLAHGRVRAVVGFAPLRPAEFVVFALEWQAAS